ncbi:DUF3105 domain-containing protein [Mycetocola zhadangensis]|uniref:DUF3105 domain-containing protein n=1 Tax=Mycetocola zhadangensis TaxID=1164595 RepID=A0A3L7IS94_9MICO|nr:DUF3105 domain-containing protein [Mycetocola zhadangensis]GGF03660.1 membrane protein [Mycetocola zhadangensis]
MEAAPTRISYERPLLTPRDDSPAETASKSGNPAKQKTIKEQRAEQRTAKVEAFKKEQARKRRNKRIGIGAAIVGGVAVVALLVTSIVLTIPKNATYEAGGSGAKIEGVETFQNSNTHVETAVDYPQTPPAGGDHNPAWLNCGIYTEVQQSENAVHSLEHGAIWVTYDPSISDEELELLKEKLPSTYVILSPFEELPTPIVLSGWDVQLQVEDASDERITEFFEEYWKSENVPEPGALCTGAVEGPGKA